MQEITNAELKANARKGYDERRLLEENFGSVQIFGHRLAFLRHCHLRWPNDQKLKAEYNKHMVKHNIN